MKKIIIGLILLTHIKINGSFWDSITSVVHKVSDGIQNAGETAVGGLKKAGEATGGFFKNQVGACTEVTGLQIAHAFASEALQAAKQAINSADIMDKKAILDSAQIALEDIQKSSHEISDLTNSIADALGKELNITCIRFFGSIEELEFELNATILGKSISIREKVDFTDAKSFAQKIFDLLQDEVKKII